MKKPRRKRAPTIDLDAIASLKAGTHDRDLTRLKSRLADFEELRAQQVLNTPFIALEAISALAGGLVTGKTEAELRSTWPKTWGDETISVPLALLLALRDAWSDYRHAGPGVTLGEAFGIEGAKSQGSHRMKSKLATLDREVKDAIAVELEYLISSLEGKGTALEDVTGEVSGTVGKSAETVGKHHRKHADTLRNKLKKIGVLKEPKVR